MRNLGTLCQCSMDIEFDFPLDSKKWRGFHSRQIFDLKAHSEFSKKKQQYSSGNSIEKITSLMCGVLKSGRPFVLLTLCNALQKRYRRESRTYLKLHPALPLSRLLFFDHKKDGLPEKAQELVELLSTELKYIYEMPASLEKRYARQDLLIGTPFCIAWIIDAGR